MQEIEGEIQKLETPPEAVSKRPPGSHNYTNRDIRSLVGVPYLRIEVSESLSGEHPNRRALKFLREHHSNRGCDVEDGTDNGGKWLKRGRGTRTDPKLSHSGCPNNHK